MTVLDDPYVVHYETQLRDDDEVAARRAFVLVIAILAFVLGTCVR